MAKKKPGKAVLSMKDLEAEMFKDASDASARTAAIGGNTIGIRNSKFSYKNEVIGRTLEAVVVDHIFCNAYYDIKFDADNPAPPACIAISVDGEDMTPEKNSPKRQSDYCDGCPQNAWGTADVGNGKACAEQYKLAIIQPGQGEDYSTAEMAVLTFPPTSRKNWTKYVKDIQDKLGRPPYGVVTLFGFEQDAEWPILEPELAKKITSAKDLNDIRDRLKEARNMLITPPDFSTFVPKTKKPRAKKKASKKTASKKTAKKSAKKKTGSRKSKFTR